jgi:hypothetical protein
MGAEASMGLMAGGTAMSATSQFFQGQYNKKIANYNADVARIQAQDALDRGTDQEQRFRVGVRRMIGAQRVGYASQGVDVNRGSAVDIQADAQRLGELDALEIRSNAAREAWGYKVQATNYQNQGRMAAMSGTMGAISSLAVGGAQSYAMYSAFNAAGAFNTTGTGGAGSAGRMSGNFLPRDTA